MRAYIIPVAFIAMEAAVFHPEIPEQLGSNDPGEGSLRLVIQRQLENYPHPSCGIPQFT